MTGLGGDVREWLKGRKTYTLSGVLLLVTLGLLLSGHLTPTAALTLLMVAAFSFPATFRAALKRHQQEEIALLQQFAAMGAALAARDFPVLQAVALAAAQSTAGLCEQIHEETEGPNP